MDLLCF